MTKATEALLTIFSLSSVYFALYVQLIPTPETFHKEILPLLPLWSIVTLGSYSLGVLGFRVLTFKDKPQKYKELLGQIEEAREFFKLKGVDLDE